MAHSRISIEDIATFKVTYNDIDFAVVETITSTESLKNVGFTYSSAIETRTIYPSVNDTALLIDPVQHTSTTIERLKMLSLQYADNSGHFFRVEIKLAGNKTKICRFDNSQSIQTCIKLMNSSGIMFGYTPARNLIGWKDKSLDKHYDQFDINTYQSLFEVAATHLEPVLAASPENNLLISPACGIGDDLFYIDKKLARFNLKLAGFDINKSNISQVNEKFSFKSTNEKMFETNNLNLITNFIKKVNQHFPVVNQKIYLFSGVLAHTISSNATAALNTLQRTMRDNYNHIIIMSLTSTFIDARIAKAAGLKMVNMAHVPPQPSRHGQMINAGPVSIYSKPSETERVNYILTQSAKRKLSTDNIDLSCSAFPLEDLRLLLKHEAQTVMCAKQLDLSWSYITPEEIAFLVNEIKKCQFNLILVSPDNLKLGQAISKSLPTMKIYTRRDVYNDRTLPYASISCNRRMGFFTSLPSEPLYLPREQNTPAVNQGNPGK